MPAAQRGAVLRVVVESFLLVIPSRHAGIAPAALCSPASPRRLELPLVAQLLCGSGAVIPASLVLCAAELVLGGDHPVRHRVAASFDLRGGLVLTDNATCATLWPTAGSAGGPARGGGGDARWAALLFRDGPPGRRVDHPLGAGLCRPRRGAHPSVGRAGDGQLPRGPPARACVAGARGRRRRRSCALGRPARWRARTPRARGRQHGDRVAPAPPPDGLEDLCAAVRPRCPRTVCRTTPLTAQQGSLPAARRPPSGSLSKAWRRSSAPPRSPALYSTCTAVPRGSSQFILPL